MKKDRFDFEQEILRCWQVTDDIDLLYRQVTDHELSGDELQNALLGMKIVYNLKFNELWDTFEDFVHNKKLV